MSLSFWGQSLHIPPVLDFHQTPYPATGVMLRMTLATPWRPFLKEEHCLTAESLEKTHVVTQYRMETLEKESQCLFQLRSDPPKSPRI